MKKEKVTLKNEKIAVIGDSFNEEDFVKLKKIFEKWQDLNKDLKNLGGRNLNVPDVLSEALFCYIFDAVRTNNTAYSYDCVLKTGEGVQVKSSSIKIDCTSFGPKSKWDLLYFVDFAPNGNVDGNVDIYEINTDDIYSIVLNTKENQTFEDQQKQKRRPRFSIKEKIIHPKKIKPCHSIKLF